jgi:hypothetical protein
MSRIEELASKAASAQHEGPSYLDDLAHKIAMIIVNRTFTEEEGAALTRLTRTYREVYRVVELCNLYDTRPAGLRRTLAQEIADAWAAEEHDFTKLNDLRDDYIVVIAHQDKF